MVQGTVPAARSLAAVVVVIVTYGDRSALLARTVHGVNDSPNVARIIVVDNGSAPPVAAEALGSVHIVDVIRNDGNLGSAGGFAQGIAAALAISDATHLAVLDDDNLGNPGYLEDLLALHDAYGGDDDVALSALRSDRPHYRALLRDPAAVEYLPGSFLGFEVRNLARRAVRKLLRRSGTAANAVHVRRISRAPYGGLFLTMALARRLGPPRADFILYGDDHEYTRRLTSSGATLLLTDHARIEDIDQSWNLAVRRGARWIDDDAAQWRIYYAARNHHFLERSEPDVGAMLTINRWTLSLRLLAEAAIRYRRPARIARALRPFRAAIADARAGRLGFNPSYPLPGWHVAPREPGGKKVDTTEV